MGTRGDHVFLLINTALSYGCIGPSVNGKDRHARVSVGVFLRGSLNLIYVTIIDIVFTIKISFQVKTSWSKTHINLIYIKNSKYLGNNMLLLVLKLQK